MHFVKCVLCTNLAENVYWKFVCIYELHSDHVQCDWSGDLTILEDWLQKMGIFWCFFHQKRKKVISLQTRTRISTLSFDKIVLVWRKYYAWQKNFNFFLVPLRRKRIMMTSISLFRLGTTIQIHIIEKNSLHELTNQ